MSSAVVIFFAFLSFLANVTAQVNAITQPSNGKIVYAGDPFQIQWEKQRFFGNVSLNLTKSDNSTVVVLASSTPNSGLFPWNVAATTVPGNDYIIQIGSGPSFSQVTSSAPFIIQKHEPPVQVPSSTVIPTIHTQGIPTGVTFPTNTATSPPDPPTDYTKVGIILGSTLGALAALIVLLTVGFRRARHLNLGRKPSDDFSWSRHAPSEHDTTDLENGERTVTELRVDTLAELRETHCPSETEANSLSTTIPPENHSPILAGGNAEIRTSVDPNSRITRSKFEILFPSSNPSGGLINSFGTQKREITELLDKLQNWDLCFGLDILDDSLTLQNPSDEKLFLGSRETLWVDFEASLEQSSDDVRKILESIAHYVDGHPVVATDVGPLSLGTILVDLTYQRSDTDSVTDNLTPSQSSPSTTSATFRSSPTTHNSEVYYTHCDDDGRTHEEASSSGENQINGNTDASRTTDNGKRTGDRRHTEPPHDSNNDNDEEDDDRSQKLTVGPSPSLGSEVKDNLFRGELTLRLNDSHTQNFYTNIGLSINPLQATDHWANCDIVLDPVVVNAGVVNNGTDYTYKILSFSISIGTSKVPQPPRRGWWPDLSAFYDKGPVTAKKSPKEVAVQLGLNPKATFKMSYDDTTTIESSRLLLKVRPEDALANDNDGKTWKYRVAPGSSQDIQMHKDEPPVHGVRHTIYADDLPESVVVKVKATFIRVRVRARRRVLSKKPEPSPPRHIVTCLEVRRVNEGMEWFRFPTATKQGSRSTINGTLQGGTIREDSRTDGPMVNFKASVEASKIC